MSKLFIFMLIVLFSGCASASSRHQSRIAELDAQYKAHKIDAAQYQEKYSEEVDDYNLRRSFALGMRR